MFGPGEGVPEAGHVHTGKLQLGGGVEARERGVAAVQPVGNDLGHGVGGGHQAQAHATEVGHLADGPDAGDLCGAEVVDRHAAALAQAEQLLLALGRAEELVAGPDAHGDNHQVCQDDAFVSHEHSGDLAVVVRQNFAGEHAAVHFEALGLDQAAKGLPGALVQLGVHEPGCTVDDHGSGAELLRAGGRLEAQEAATDGHGVDFAAQLFG
nr:hypothetical protein [Arthrobacter sp. FW306-05-C]